MLGTVRKFSSSPYAKIFLAIVVLPFIFWGMGPVFQGGKKNTIVEVGDKKISNQEFIDFIKYKAEIPNNETLNKDLLKKLLYNFIGEKLIDQEIKNFDIKLSNESLSKIIKNEEVFKRNNKFSRTEYEKFLVTNSLNANSFETNMRKQITKDHLFELIGGGILPPNFLVDIGTY